MGHGIISFIRKDKVMEAIGGITSMVSGNLVLMTKSMTKSLVKAISWKISMETITLFLMKREKLAMGISWRELMELRYSFKTQVRKRSPTKTCK